MRIARGLILASVLLLPGAACAGADQMTPQPTATPRPAGPTPTAASTPRRADEPADLAPDVLAILNGTLIDGTGADPVPDAYVVVRDGQIAEVGTGDPQIPADTAIVDAHGGTILPGLVDAHVHITREIVGSGADLRVNQEGLLPWLTTGVTTLRDVGTAPIIFPSALTFVDSLIRQKKAPRVIWAGPIITAIGGYPLTVPPYAVSGQEVASAEEARQLVYQLADDGARIIKLGLERGYFRDEGWPLLSLEEVKAISEAAHQRGLLVTAHVTSLDEVRLALDGGVDDLAHTPLEPLTNELIQEMLENGMTMATTASIWSPEGSVTAAENAKRYMDAGGVVALATDFGCCGQVQGIVPLIIEMEFLQAAGFTNMELIVAATRNGAIVSNVGDELGTVEPGKIADIMVVVGGKPLDHIRELALPAVVIQDGEVVWE